LLLQDKFALIYFEWLIAFSRARGIFGYKVAVWWPKLGLESFQT